MRQGKILYPAVSNFAAWQTMKALGVAARSGLSPIVATQPMYNLAKRQAEVEILPMARAEQLAVIPYSPLGGGLLTGKYRGGAKSGRLVDWKMYAVRYEGAQAIGERFADFAEARDLSPVSLAVAWVASHPSVTSVLLGARNTEQLAPALASLDLAMTEELRAEVSALSPAPPPATDRNEETSEHNFGAR